MQGLGFRVQGAGLPHVSGREVAALVKGFRRKSRVQGVRVQARRMRWTEKSFRLEGRRRALQKRWGGGARSLDTTSDIKRWIDRASA